MTLPRMMAARTLQRATLVPGAPSSLVRGRPGMRLPAEIRELAEGLFREDLSDVRVHLSAEPRRMRARAFTSGADIYVAPDQYDPGSDWGLRLLGHELAHVVQQRRGRVQNPHGYGVAVIRDAALEAEADRMGEALLAEARRAVPGPDPTLLVPRPGAMKGQAQRPARLDLTIQRMETPQPAYVGMTFVNEPMPVHENGYDYWGAMYLIGLYGEDLDIFPNGIRVDILEHLSPKTRTGYFAQAPSVHQTILLAWERGKTYDLNAIGGKPREETTSIDTSSSGSGVAIHDGDEEVVYQWFTTNEKALIPGSGFKITKKISREQEKWFITVHRVGASFKLKKGLTVNGGYTEDVPHKVEIPPL